MDPTTVSISATKGEKLKESHQWRTWYNRIRLYAKERGVWDVCNPELADDDILAPLDEPERPEYPQGGSKEEKVEWRDLMDVYKYEYSDWEKQRKALSDVNQIIIALLDPSHHPSLLPYETPYERLKYLKSRFARSGAYREELRTRWLLNQAEPPRKGIDVLMWIEEWNNLREEVISAGLENEV